MMLTQERINELISRNVGSDAVDIVQFLIKSGENTSEFIVSEQLKIPINQVRNILYRLQQQNLVTFIRKKDKKKGWYIYYWTFNDSHAETLEKSLKTEKLVSLKKRLSKEETEEFFTCARSCMRLTFTRALENNFKCPECDRILKRADNKKVIKEIKKELAELEGLQEALAAA